MKHSRLGLRYRGYTAKEICFDITRVRIPSTFDNIAVFMTYNVDNNIQHILFGVSAEHILLTFPTYIIRDKIDLEKAKKIRYKILYENIAKRRYIMAYMYPFSGYTELHVLYRSLPFKFYIHGCCKGLFTAIIEILNMISDAIDTYVMEHHVCHEYFVGVNKS